MAQIVEEIPPALEPAVKAALSWLGDRDGRAYGVSGLVDPEGTLAQQVDGAPSLDLRLIVCAGDLCLREDVRLRRRGEVLEVFEAPGSDDDPPAELDPAPGVRTAWLDETLEKHAFVLLLFYRGFW